MCQKMDKPILIDALHITMGGGRGLLDYLVSSLIQRQVVLHLLRDERCSPLKEENIVGRVFVMEDNGNARKKFYKLHRNDYSSVLCFGNIPAPIKMPCPVHTYVHNVNLLRIPKEFSFKMKLMAFLKRQYIRHLSSNTDSWIVQTQFTEDLLRKYMPCKGKQIVQYPFYNLPTDIVSAVKNSEHGEDYVLIGGYTWNRGHEELVEAWGKLAEKGFKKKLHLTVRSTNLFQDVFDEAINKGAVIENHGFIPYEEVLKLYGKCKAIVYPSHGESFGLGIVEAISCGCDVLSSDLPFTYSVCKPSEVFEVGNPEAIAEAVMRYEKGDCVKSKLTVSDKINDLIDYLSN